MRKLWVVFLVPVMVFALSWQVDVDVSDGAATRTITWGVEPGATDGYDHGIDENFPILPPSGIYAYFPISDPANPYITMLSRDIRKDTLAEHIWKFTGGGTFDTLTATWNPLYLPVGDIFVGVSPSLDEPPTEMVSMTDIDQIKFYPYQFVWIDFVPAAAGDVSTPPFVVSTYPENGATGVPADTEVRVLLSDAETGIDPASIAVRVNGTDVTPAVSVARTGNNWVVTYRPAGGFTPGATVSVSVSFADFDDTPNEAEYSFSFTVGAAPMPVAWEIPLEIMNIGSTGDTSWADISFGAAEDASDMFDPGYDVPFPVPMPGVFYAYFPLDDPSVEFTMLSRDIRSSFVDNEWLVRFGNPGVMIRAMWNVDDLPEDVNLYIGVAMPSEEPDHWIPMSSVSYFDIAVGQWLWIRSELPAPPDTEPPYLVSSVPEIGATGVAPETDLSIVVSDWGAGVDTSSIVLYVNGEDVTDECEISVVGENVYITYSPDSGFEPSSRVDWELYVADLADPANSTTIDGYFTTGFYPTPEWMTDLRLHAAPASGDEFDMTITFGLDEAGTDHFDIGLDYLYAPPPPGAVNFYFYIDDTIWTQLARDIRSAYADSVVWMAVFTNLDATTDYAIRWNPEDLPESGDFEYAVTNMSGEPEEWFSMRDNDSVPVMEDGKFYIRYISELPRYCLSGSVVLEGTEDYSGTVVEIPALGVFDTTDYYGHYEICDIPPGEYEVVISHEGYVSQTETLTINSDVDYDAYLELIRYTVSGVVIPEGMPEGERDGIPVTLGDSMTAYTDSDGYFEFDGVLPGNYALHVEYEGYEPVDTSVEVNSDVNLTIELRLIRYTVSGWVELSDQPSGNWGGTEVSLGDMTVITDDDGYFEFTDVLPGDYEFSASHDGYLPFDTTLTVDDDISLTITLEPEETTRYGNVLVIVSLEGSSDLAGTRVVIEELADTAFTNPMGRTRFWDVPYGTYTLEISRENYQTLTQELVVDAPSETVNVTLNLKRGVIEGFVYLSDSLLDLSGTSVSLDDYAETTSTDMTGYFRFEDVPYGEHTLHFERFGYSSYDTTFVLADPGTVDVVVMLERELALNPPRNVRVISGLHNRVAIRWDPPEPSGATLLGYGIIRSSFSGIDTIGYVPYWCTSLIDYDGVTGLFSVYAVYEEGNSDAVGYLVGYPGDNPDAPDVLIIDFDNGALLADNGTADEATALRDLLWTGQVTCQVTGQDENIDTLELLRYKAVFVVTGVRDDDNTMLSENSILKLFDYLAAGGRVYWEGADVAADYATMFDSTFGGVMGVFMASDGRPGGLTGNVVTLSGQPPYFETGSTFDYQHGSPADHYVDEFYTTTTSSPMMYSQTSNPAPLSTGLRMVANDVDLSTFSDFTSHWRDVVSSVYLGAIDYRDNSSNAYEVLRRIWNFLFDEELPSGVEETASKIPSGIEMTLNPTPFNSSVEITLNILRSITGKLEITDISGKMIASLYEGELGSGVAKFKWNAAKDVPSGTYLVIFETGDGHRVVGKAVLIR